MTPPLRKLPGLRTLTAALVALTLLSACSGRPAPAATAEPPATAAPPATATPGAGTPDAGAPDAPGRDQDGSAGGTPGQEPTADAAPADGAPADGTPAAPGPEGPLWYQRKPGYPMVTDDESARSSKVVLLTFDDGPHPEYTPLILDTLKRYNVKALWFVTSNAQKYPDLIRRIHDEGHEIGTHTLYHEKLTDMSLDKQREAILPVNAIVEELTGQKVRFFRPPFGAYNDDTRTVMTEAGMELINWSHGSCDWCEVKGGYKDPAEVVADTLAAKPRKSDRTRLHPGAIILMHDTLKHTAEALPDILAGLEEQGYTFTMLSTHP